MLASPAKNDGLNCDDGPFAAVGLDFVFGWAPGKPSLTFPENVGIPMGDAGSFQSFRLIVHYDNPANATGIVDNTRLRIYYSSEPRELEMGTILLGDPIVSMIGEKVGDAEVNEHTYFCPSQCSSSILSGPVTVIQEVLRMHQSGARAFFEHIRGGEVIRKGEFEYWDGGRQQSLVVQQDHYEIRPGDEFTVGCQFAGHNEKVWGLGARVRSAPGKLDWCLLAL